MKIAELQRRQIRDLWSIDRTEKIDAVYYRVGSDLVLEPEHHDVRGWPPGEPEQYGPILLDCFDRGGTFYGAFDGERLIGAAVLESRFIGRAKDQLQLKFLHVSRRYRKAGVGSQLFEKLVARANELGAGRLYISSTPSENTVRFYLRRGCRVAEEVDAALFELEPADIHLEFDVPQTWEGSALARRKKRAKRDIEKDYPPLQFAAKLRRLADCIEEGKRFRIQVAGERISIPPAAQINIEHERGASEEEVEFQLRWKLRDPGARG